MKRTLPRLFLACTVLTSACDRSPHRMRQYERGRDTAEHESKLDRTPLSFNGQPTPTAWLYNPDSSKRWQLPRLNDDNALASPQELLLVTYQLRHDCEQAASAYRHSRNTAQSLAEVNAALLAGLIAGQAVEAFGRAHPELLGHVQIASDCSDDSWHWWFGCYPLTAPFNGCTGDNTSRIY